VSIKAFVDGITASVIGALVGSVIVIGLRSITDIPTIIIGISAVLALLYIKKVKEPHIIAIAALIGVLIKAFF
jgi:chromate transporter